MSVRHLYTLAFVALLSPALLSAQSRSTVDDERYRSGDRRERQEETFREQKRSEVRDSELRGESERARMGDERRRSGASNIDFTTEIDVKRPLSPEDQRALSVAAGRILVHTNNARMALQREDADRAQEQIEKAVTLSKIVQRNAPTFNVSTTISSGDLEYSDRSEVAALVVPVYTELERVSIIGPVLNAKQGVSEMQRSSSKGQQDLRARRSSQQDIPMQQTGAVVQDVGLVSTSMSLDVNSAASHLQAAQQALERGDEQRASDLLTAVQQSVTLSFVEADLPLVKARQNLMAAKLFAKSGRSEEAGRALREVADSLEVYEQKVGKSRAQEVAQLRGDIMETARNVPDSERGIDRQVDSWWDQLREWQA